MIEIDRDKAAQLGLSMSQVGSALGGLLGGAYTNYFSLGSRSYKVISQVQQRSRLTIDQVMRYQIATINGAPIPISAIARVRQETVPQTITHFQQQNSGHHLRRAGAGRFAGRRAADTCRNLAAQTLPRDMLIDYAGPLRQFVQESSGFAGDLRAGADHHLPVPGGAVRKFPRSAGDPGVDPDVDRRRAGVHQPGLRRRQPRTSTPRSGWSR